MVTRMLSEIEDYNRGSVAVTADQILAVSDPFIVLNLFS